MPWFTVLFGAGVWFKQQQESQKNVFVDVHAALQSFSGDEFNINVINSMNTPIFLADPKLSCKLPGENWFESSRPGFEAQLLPSASAPGQLGPGDFRNLNYRLGPGIDRKKLSSTPNVVCAVWFYYSGVYPGGLMAGLSGQGLFPMLKDDVLATFLEGGGWP